MRWSLVAVVLLAGCLSSTAPTEAPGEPEPEPTFAFGPAIVPDGPDGFGSEPSLLAAADGTLYFSSVLGSADARGDGVWRSKDAGATWDYLGKVDYPFGGGDSDVEEDDSGRLYVTGQWRGVALPAYVANGEAVATSDDGGETWTVHPNSGIVPTSDRQWLAGYQGTMWLTYNTQSQGLVISETTDGGVTWSPPVPVEGPTSVGPTGIAGDMVIDSQGNIYIPYGPGPGGSGDQRVLVSTDGGDSFSDHTVRSGGRIGAIFAGMAVDAEDTLYIAWAEEVDSGMAVLMAYSADGAATWSGAMRVNPDNTTAVFPWIVAGAAGKVAVTYYGADGTTLPDNAAADLEWTPMAAFSLDARNGTFDAVPMGAVNHVGPICTGGTGCSGGRLLGDFFESALTPDGRVAAVWVDDQDPDARTNMVAVQSDGPTLR